MMAKKSEPGLIVGLDVGTSKIEAVVGELTEEGEIEIIGIGSSPSRGLKKGVVVNIESTVQSIQRAVEEAELMAGCEIHSVYTGIAGSHIKSYNSTGVVAIKDGEVVAGDVDRVIDAARAIAIPADQRILHVLPQEYIIDEQEGIREPIGMSGVRLEAKVHLVTGAVSAAQNIVKCVERCGLRVDDIILEQLASSYSVLSEDEKDLGVCLVDVGGGTTDIAVFAHGAIMHTAVIPIAGDQVTNDIAVALRTPTQYAEELKFPCSFGLRWLAVWGLRFAVAGVVCGAAWCLWCSSVAFVVLPGCAGLLALVASSLGFVCCGFVFSAGVLLGGGSFCMAGVLGFASVVFCLLVGVGVPGCFVLLLDVLEHPVVVAGVGLLVSVGVLLAGVVGLSLFRGFSGVFGVLGLFFFVGFCFWVALTFWRGGRFAGFMGVARSLFRTLVWRGRVDAVRTAVLVFAVVVVVGVLLWLLGLFLGWGLGRFVG